MPHRQATTQRVAGAGLELVVDTYGLPANPPVVLLHGGGQTRHSWQRAGRQLASEGWYVLSMDQGGHGESDWSEDGDYRFDHFVEDLRRLIDSMDQPPRPGGRVAWRHCWLADPGCISCRGWGTGVISSPDRAILWPGIRKVLPHWMRPRLRLLNICPTGVGPRVRKGCAKIYANTPTAATTGIGITG